MYRTFSLLGSVALIIETKNLVMFRKLLLGFSCYHQVNASAIWKIVVFTLICINFTTCRIHCHSKPWMGYLFEHFEPKQLLGPVVTNYYKLSIVYTANHAGVQLIEFFKDNERKLHNRLLFALLSNSKQFILKTPKNYAGFFLFFSCL